MEKTEEIEKCTCGIQPDEVIRLSDPETYQIKCFCCGKSTHVNFKREKALEEWRKIAKSG